MEGFLCKFNSCTSAFPAVESFFVMLNEIHIILPSIFVTEYNKQRLQSITSSEAQGNHINFYSESG